MVKVLAQAPVTWVSAPQLPVYTATAAVLLVLLSCIMWLADVATKEYHASSFVPPALHEGAVSVDGVAPKVVPEVEVHTRFDDGVKETALPQLSLAGAGTKGPVYPLNAPPVQAVLI